MLINFLTGQTEADDIMFIIRSDKNILIWTSPLYEFVPKQLSCEVEVAFKNTSNVKN